MPASTHLHTFAALAALTALTGTSLAQNPGAEPPPPYSLKASATFTGDSSLRHNGNAAGDCSVSEYNATFGMQLNREFSASISQELTELDQGGSASLAALPKHLRSTSLKLNWFHPVNREWVLLARGGPAWSTAGDSGSFAAKGLGAEALAGARLQLSPTSSLSFGLFYKSMRRSSLRVLPFVGYESRISDLLSLKLGLPETALTWHLGSALDLSLQVEASGGGYYLEKDPLPNLESKPSLARTRLDFTDVRAGLALDWKFSPESSLSLGAGSVVYRNFDYNDRGYELKASGGAPYLSLSARLRF